MKLTQASSAKAPLENRFFKGLPIFFMKMLVFQWFRCFVGSPPFGASSWLLPGLLLGCCWPLPGLLLASPLEHPARAPRQSSPPEHPCQSIPLEHPARASRQSTPPEQNPFCRFAQKNVRALALRASGGSPDVCLAVRNKSPP